MCAVNSVIGAMSTLAYVTLTIHSIYIWHQPCHQYMRILGRYTSYTLWTCSQHPSTCNNVGKPHTLCLQTREYFKSGSTLNQGVLIFLSLFNYSIATLHNISYRNKPFLFYFFSLNTWLVYLLEVRSTTT